MEARLFTYQDQIDAEKKMTEAYKVYIDAQRKYDMIRQVLHSEFMRSAMANVK